jgi:hypothetical protein
MARLGDDLARAATYLVGRNRFAASSDALLYNMICVKTYKTLLAIYCPTGGVIRVMLVKEDHGWYDFLCTDLNTNVREIPEAFSDRAMIVFDFHDVKEVWDAGQQQLSNIWLYIAAYNLHLWMHTLVELWAWNRPRDELCAAMYCGFQKVQIYY